jgi:hypothetical protein
MIVTFRKPNLCITLLLHFQSVMSVTDTPLPWSPLMWDFEFGGVN